MKLAVVGSRDINDYKFIENHIRKYNPLDIISGGAKGVDSLAKRYAIENNISITEIKPEYNAYNRKFAPLLRNKEIVNQADFVLIFWDGQSKGTKYVIDYCKKQNQQYEIIIFGSV